MSWAASDVGWTLLLFVAAVASGVINTVAGGGSFLTIPLLLATGVPVHAALGTIRVGVVAQNVTSLVTFHRRGIAEWGTIARLVPVMSFGALLGAWTALRLSPDRLRPVVGALLLAWAVILLARPGRLLTSPECPRPITAWTQLLGFAIGAYGGFIQAGVGFPLMALLVFHLGFDAVRANCIKVGLVLIFTLCALPPFLWRGDVWWFEGGVLAVGSWLGGWLGTRWQLHGGARLVHVVVVVAVTFSGVLLVMGR